MAPECGWVTMTTMVGVTKKKKNLQFFHDWREAWWHYCDGTRSSLDFHDNEEHYQEKEEKNPKEKVQWKYKNDVEKTRFLQELTGLPQGLWFCRNGERSRPSVGRWMELNISVHARMWSMCRMFITGKCTEIFLRTLLKKGNGRHRLILKDCRF